MSANVMLVLPSLHDGPPRRRRVPSNLLALASSLAPIPGVATEVLDAESLGWNGDDVVQHARKIAPAIIGISVCSPVYARARAISESLVRALPECVVVLGGKHITHCWKEVAAETTGNRVLVLGEGEGAIAHLARAAIAGSADSVVEAAAQLTNTWTPLTTRTPELPTPCDIGQRELWPYSVLNPALPVYRGDRMLIEFSRGCRGRCAYCLAPSYRRGLAWRDAAAVVREMKYLVEQGFRQFFFTDDDVAASPERLAELCRAICDASLEVELDANVRPDSLCKCESLTGLLRRTGFRCLWLGVESGSADMLTYYGKGFGRDACDRAIPIAHAASRLVKTNWIIGSPYENEHSVVESIEFALAMRRHGPHLPHVSYMVPYPGTQVYRDCIKLGLTTRDELDRRSWETHSGPIMPTLHLSRERLAELYAGFHRQVYNDAFLASVSPEVRREADGVCARH